MSRASTTIKDFSDDELVLELVRRLDNLMSGLTKRQGKIQSQRDKLISMFGLPKSTGAIISPAPYLPPDVSTSEEGPRAPVNSAEASIRQSTSALTASTDE